MVRPAQTPPAPKKKTKPAESAPAAPTTERPFGRSPLGVPSDIDQPDPYQAPFTAASPGASLGALLNRQHPATIGPTYFDGDQYGPFNNPEGVPSLQAQLVQSGLLKADDVRLGLWDERNANAYRNVLEMANRYGITAQQAMSLFMQNPSFGQQLSGGGGGGASRTVTLANPQDLQAVANEVAPKVIGRRLTDQELGQFVGSFHGLQGGGGNPPSLDVAAEAFAREKAPTESTARDLKDVFDVVLNMMSGGGRSAG